MALTAEILQLPMLTLLLSGKYHVTTLLSTQLQHHLFSASLVELDSTANPQLSSLTHQPTTSLLQPSQVKVKVTLQLMVSQSVSLGVEPHLGLMTRYLLLFESYGLVFVGRPL
jgi:hypothetical protein